MSICQRCGKETLATIGSYFDDTMICPDCRKKEESHPSFNTARAVEEAAVRRGNYNFPGVGKPVDL